MQTDSLNFPLDIHDNAPTFLVGGNSALNDGRGGPSKALTGMTGLALIASATPAEARAVLGWNFGIPFTFNVPVVVEYIHNGNTLILIGALTVTVPKDLATGFGCAVKGNATFVAGTDVTITDVRIAGEPNPWCAIVQVAPDTYDIVGTKV